MREMRRLNAWLNGQDLRSLDPRILIREINEGAPEVETEYGAHAGWPGQYLLGSERRNRRITITFAVRELYDTAERARVIDAVNAWAQDGYLMVSYRPQRRIWVHRVAPAAPDTIRDYTAVYSVAFDAAASPYWEDVTTTSWTATGSSASGTLSALGNRPIRVTASVVPSGTLNTCSITVGSTSMSFTGLSVASGKTLAIAYDEQGILSIQADGAGKLSCRSAASSDDLIALPGDTAVSFTAGVSCAVTLEARALWQ